MRLYWCVCDFHIFQGIRSERGKTLAAFIKAIGYIIPLMEPEHADVFTKQVMKILIREMASPEEEMKRIVLQVCVKQISVCVYGRRYMHCHSHFSPSLF
jgi:hypothetical protein